MQDRPGGAGVAVERHADAAGVDEPRFAGLRGALELDVRVAEYERRLGGVADRVAVLVGSARA